MEQQELDEKIVEVSQAIHRYCSSRTANVHDAEDLAQEMLLEIYKSTANIRDDKAFYGFMWTLVGNVYKQWYKKKLRRNTHEISYSESDNEEPDNAVPENAVPDLLETDSDIRRLRRELALLAEKYRRATILYYLENKSCSEIAHILSVSESMVKYLLFKSRQIVKDGMNMERNYGEQSYNPKEMLLHFWGSVNNYYDICKDLISQNILFACYNDKLNEEQISLEIGVAVPYLEEFLKELVEYELLKKDGNRYFTNIVIFTKEFTEESDTKTLAFKKKIADLLKQVLSEKEQEIRAIGFKGCDMDRNTYAWQMSCILLDMAIVEKLQDNIQLEFPVDKFGERCFLFGVELFAGSGNTQRGISKGFGLGRCDIENDRGDLLQFMDFGINGERVHNYFFNDSSRRNVFGDIASGETDNFSENDRATAADMVKRGYVKNENGELSVNAPVFTRTEYEKLKEILQEASIAIAVEAENLMEVVSRILKNHAPVHLRKTAGQMAYFRLLGDAISGTLSILYDENYLHAAESGAMLPTTYVVVK